MTDAIIIDAKDLIAGRIGAYAAKQALLGHTIQIYNADQAIITGKRKMLLAAWQRRNKMGVWSKGPFIPKVSDRFLRRIIRGMLPYKTARGLAAYRRILCHIGQPEGMQSNVEIPRANITASRTHNYLTIQEICRSIGGKQ